MVQRKRNTGNRFNCEKFWVPVYNDNDERKVQKVIEILPYNLSSEHNEPEQKIRNWLKGLTPFQRMFFVMKASQLEKNDLLKKLKDLAVLDPKAITAKAQELGLFPHFRNDLPARADQKFGILIEQMIKQSQADNNQAEKLNKLKDWYRGLTPKQMQEVTFTLAPLDGMRSRYLLLGLLDLTADQKLKYLNLEEEGDDQNN